MIGVSIVKILLVAVLLIIIVQDIKERQVYWFLFPVIGLCCGILHYYKTIPVLFYKSLLMNLIFVSILLSIVFLYARFKLKAKFNTTFGLGDMLLFFTLTVSFSTISFIIIFVFALIFSLVLHLIIKKKANETVPLAGYMSVFFGFVYLGHWSGFINSVYTV